MQRDDGKNSIQQTLDLIDDENFSKCFAAIDADDAARLRALIEHGADIMQATRNGKLAVTVAAIKDSWDCVAAILDHLRPTLRSDDWHHDAARKLSSKLGEVFLLAVKTNQLERLDWLKKYTGNEHKYWFFIKEFRYTLGHKLWQDSNNGYTALHWAVQNDNFTLINVIVGWKYWTNYEKILEIKNADNETFLDLAFRLKKVSWIKKDFGRCGNRRFSFAVQASKIETLYDLLMLNVFAYSDSKQDKLLEYMLALPDSDKSVALPTALNQTTALGAYMAKSKQCERYRRIMQNELQKLAQPPEVLPAPPTTSGAREEAEELKPIFRQIPGVRLTFPSVPKKPDDEKKDRKKKSEEKDKERKEQRPSPGKKLVLE